MNICGFVTLFICHTWQFFSQNIQSIAQNKKRNTDANKKKECFVSTWINVFFQILPIEKWVLCRHFSSGQEVLKGTINMRINGQKEMSWIAILTIGTFPDENKKNLNKSWLVFFLIFHAFSFITHLRTNVPVHLTLALVCPFSNT